MGVVCFMVESISDLWEDGGARRVGAMTWRSHPPMKGETQQRPLPHLAVMTPAGIVCLHCPASDNPNSYWEVTGEPPEVTVKPSLNVNKGEWHGWVRNGQLVT